MYDNIHIEVMYIVYSVAYFCDVTYSINSFILLTFLNSHYSVEPQSYDVPKPDGHIRMVCISDTHNRTDNLKLPDGDILIHAGDFSNVGLEGDIHRFTEFLTKQHHKHKVITVTIVTIT